MLECVSPWRFKLTISINHTKVCIWRSTIHGYLPTPLLSHPPASTPGSNLESPNKIATVTLGHSPTAKVSLSIAITSLSLPICFLDLALSLAKSEVLAMTHRNLHDQQPPVCLPPLPRHTLATMCLIHAVLLKGPLTIHTCFTIGKMPKQILSQPTSSYFLSLVCLLRTPWIPLLSTG